MKRLGIFSFYDRDGVAGTYLSFLLRSLSANMDTLVIAVNGIISNETMKLFKEYTAHILIRKNVGFDAGAYKDVILNYIGKKTIEEYEQIILCNDTFYGPFVPFEKILIDMDRKNVDFWGINYVENNALSHIQSFFIVLNDSIIKNGHLYEFFERYIDEKTTEIEDIYASFEIGIFDYLVKRGYRFAAYTKKKLL